MEVMVEQRRTLTKPKWLVRVGQMTSQESDKTPTGCFHLHYGRTQRLFILYYTATITLNLLEQVFRYPFEYLPPLSEFFSLSSLLNIPSPHFV